MWHEVQGGAKNLLISQTELRPPVIFSWGAIHNLYHLENINLNSGFRANLSFQAIARWAADIASFAGAEVVFPIQFEKNILDARRLSLHEDVFSNVFNNLQSASHTT